MKTINRDCLFYKGYMPCIFHKKKSVRCDSCQDYKPAGKRILVIKLDALGDVLRTTSILPVLHKKYPQAAVTWVTRGGALPLLSNDPSVIHRKLAVEANYLEFILNEKFDVGICLDTEPLSAAILNIAKCAKKYGYITDKYGQVMPANEAARQWYIMGLDDEEKKKNRKTFFEHMYRICNLEGSYARPQYSLSQRQLSFKEAFSRAKELDKYKGVIGVNTGGGGRWQFKRWTKDGYIGLIRLWKEKFPGDAVILYGGPQEKALNREISSKLGDAVIDAGCDNTIEEFASLVDISDIFLTSDSLGMHLSVAMNIMTIVLVGPTSPWELDVFGNGRIIYQDMECIGCYLNMCAKDTTCMGSITPELVLKEIENALSEKKVTV